MLFLYIWSVTFGVLLLSMFVHLSYILIHTLIKESKYGTCITPSCIRCSETRVHT